MTLKPPFFATHAVPLCRLSNACCSLANGMPEPEKLVRLSAGAAATHRIVMSCGSGETVPRTVASMF